LGVQFIVTFGQLSLQLMNGTCTNLAMRDVKIFCLLMIGIALGVRTAANAAAKTHVLSFGKWTAVSWSAEAGKPLALKIRALYVDGQIKEFTFGAPHEISDRLYAVRRAFRVNDALPDDTLPRWEWQPGGWLLVDRMSGHVTAIALPEFDPYYSAASWYRDYIAYCGISDDGKKLLGVVSQLGRRKVVLKKPLGEIGTGSVNDAVAANCFTPTWQRQPPRVTFQVKGAEMAVFAIRGRAADMVVEQMGGDSSNEAAGGSTSEDEEDKTTE
jgi:hypothetical protein